MSPAVRALRAMGNTLTSELKASWTVSASSLAMDGNKLSIKTNCGRDPVIHQLRTSCMIRYKRHELNSDTAQY